ncbi:xanthine dehydrogenase accessory protein XdhC [Roseateles asaccharophilus]|uniref:Xanthine dehydrogenase accessory factor n=1 Tax=Roseateles asaccharophilus TaxID=582607 RepID=A0ABU2A8Q6_9BURK|nr:xanthine dehydrogenase accessory protein XdhC [Roseateles asaccharophilus]MDR7333520.1 xanthine dehydrogenase accessory factor [Roseateles asaccharophilus]
MAAEALILVTVSRTSGSVPREEGAWMTVTASATTGTVGGGHLEFDAIARARAALAGGALEAEVRYPLGPGLGQCCGGVVWLRFQAIAAGEDLAAYLPVPPLRPVALFGAGHVGLAIARIARDLPLALHWVDSREAAFPTQPPEPHWQQESLDSPADAVPDLAGGSAVLIMSYSHAEDFNIVAACLKRQRERGDLAFIGLIGSRSKWASFRQRLEARGFTEGELAQVVCPIGVPGVPGKEPAVIAVAVLAQMLALPPASA